MLCISDLNHNHSGNNIWQNKEWTMSRKSDSSGTLNAQLHSLGLCRLPMNVYMHVSRLIVGNAEAAAVAASSLLRQLCGRCSSWGNSYDLLSVRLKQEFLETRLILHSPFYRAVLSSAVHEISSAFPFWLSIPLCLSIDILPVAQLTCWTSIP